MPSLYEATAAVGDVASSDFTTLYNASGLTVPNAGAGSITGNLNVAGNLTVQGSSLLIGAVTLQNTLSLPNYTFPLGDGTTDQVLVTDGSGNVYWQDVTAIPGASYTIQADNTTGGANLSLVSSSGIFDSVKFEGTGGVVVSQIDASTIAINGASLPVGTKGDVLYYDGTNWTANHVVSADTSAQRFVAAYNNSTAGINSAIITRKNFGATSYTTGDGSSIAYQVSSDAQGINTFAAIGASWDATSPKLGMSISTDNYATKTFINRFSASTAEFNGSDLILNYQLTGAPTANANFIVNRGSSTDATLTWNETTDRWEISNGLTSNGNTSVVGTLDATGVISTTAESISINSDSTATDSYLNFKGFTQYLKWNNATSSFELSNGITVNGDATITGDVTVSGVKVDLTTPVHQGQMLYVSNDVTPTITNSNIVQFTNNSYRPNFQGKTGIAGRTFSGATVSNNTGATAYDQADGSGLLVAIQSDTQTINQFGAYSTSYDTAGDHKISLGTSTNNFISIAATSITGGNTLVFSSAHGFSAGTKIYHNSKTSNGLTQATYYYVLATGLTTTQCQVSTTLGGSAVALTNGTGLTIWFQKGFTGVFRGDSTDSYIGAGNVTINAANPGIAIPNNSGLYIAGVASSGKTPYLRWIESQSLWDISHSQYTDGSVVARDYLGTDGFNLIFNHGDTTAADAYITVNRGASPSVAVKWNESTQRWQDTTDGTTYLNLPNQNLDTTSSVNFSNVTLDNAATTDTNTVTTTSTSTITIASSTRGVIKAVVHLVDNVTSAVHCVEAMVLRNGATAMVTTYGEMYSVAALANFTADVNSGSIRLLVTPASANNTTISMVGTSLT